MKINTMIHFKKEKYMIHFKKEKEERKFYRKEFGINQYSFLSTRIREAQVDYNSNLIKLQIKNPAPLHS